MNIRRLDDQRGALRLILILAYNQVPLIRHDFIEQAKENFVGKTAFYSSLEALRELGLIEESKNMKEGKRVIYTRLTAKGMTVAALVWEMEKILSDDLLPYEDR